MNVIPAAQLYPKLEAAIKANNAPDITRVEYQMLPTIEADWWACRSFKIWRRKCAKSIVPWTWSQVTRGNAIYALTDGYRPDGSAYRTDISEVHLSPGDLEPICAGCPRSARRHPKALHC